jgi:arginyl-tRNA synthetase
VVLSHPAEHELALTLLGFGDVVAQVGDALEPHRLCGYLFDLAQTFSVFYENCPVLNADVTARASRLALCRTTLDVLVVGLGMLGISAPERM